MFPRQKRLSKSTLPPAFSSGKRLASKHFSMFVPQEGSGYAVIISKKTVRLSADRHKLKRRVLEALKSLESLPESVIVFPKTSADSVSYEDVRQELAGLVAKL